jgi:hypothetical protein
MQCRAREFLDRIGLTVCEPLPFESLRDILRTSSEVVLRMGVAFSQCGNKYTLSLFKREEYHDVLTKRSQISGILSQWAHKLRKGLVDTRTFQPGGSSCRLEAEEKSGLRDCVHFAQAFGYFF